jgi:peptidoglycan/xylan/chitin deacetylase (PgdA/CDA1 family)
MKKGTLCISFDVELLWGRHGGNWLPFEQRANRVRPVIKKLLQLFKKYEIPATWAMVGHLFYTNDKLPSLYAPDIMQSISRVKDQEIGCHSLFHTDFKSPFCTKERAEMEIKECVRLAKTKKISLKSFVFPYNAVDHLDILTKYKFTCYRGDDQYSVHSPIKKLALLFDLFTPTGSPVYIPQKKNGLVEIPGSFYFLSARGYRKYIPRGVRYRKAKAGIDRAIKEKKIFHVWTHPIDFTEGSDILLYDFECMMRYASKLRSDGLLQIKNMGQIAQSYNLI